MSDFIPRGCAPLRDWLEGRSRERLPARWAFIDRIKPTRPASALSGLAGIQAETAGLSTAEIMAIGSGGKLARIAFKRAPLVLVGCLRSRHLMNQFYAVRECLYAGEVGAVAIADDGSISTIPSVFWGGSQAVGVAETGRLDGRKVLIRDCAKQGEKRTEEINSERSEPSNARAIKLATDFLVAEREASPSEQPRGKKEYFALMQKKFPGLTGYGPRKAWENASTIRPAPGWGLKGIRPKKTNEINERANRTKT